MTDEQLSEIEQRVNAATPGPWEIVLGSGVHQCTAIIAVDYTTGKSTWVADCLTEYMLKDGRVPKDHVPNMNFIAGARNDVPALVTEVRRLHGWLLQIACRPDGEMQSAMTLHYDMRGWARRALDGSLVSSHDEIVRLRVDIERIGHERDQMVAANVELQERLSTMEDDLK